MFDCWRVKRRRVKKALWQQYLAMQQADVSSSDEENASDSVAVPNDILPMESSTQQQFKDLVSAFSKQCLTHDQLDMLSRVTTDQFVGDAGPCLILPRQVYLTKVHSSVCPSAILTQFLRWPDLNSTKDLRRMEYICRDARQLIGGTVCVPGAPEVMHQPKSAQLDTLECCNPFHWSRQVPEPVMPHQRTEKQLLSMLDYASLDTDSVKEESDRCSSTETGISRICGGQVSAGTTSEFDTDLSRDYPGAKQYSAPRHARPFPAHHWCYVRYWEEKTALGTGPYKVVHPILNVSYGPLRRPSSSSDAGGAGDGMTLAAIENPNRSKHTPELRDRIGVGLTLILDETERRVRIYNRSKLSLYVSSRYLDAQRRDELDGGGRSEGEPVKVPPGWLICAFDLDWIAPPRGAGVPRAGSPVDSILVSFGKGWGTGYHRRLVTQCNCWLEIILDRVRQPPQQQHQR